MTFSSTVIESKLRTTWNVRAMPASTQATGPRPLMRAPSSLISPRSGVTWPAIELNSEVLPAPFGPIRPRISPCCTSKLISTFAATPPNDLLTRSTSSSTRALRHVAGDVARSAHADAEHLAINRHHTVAGLGKAGHEPLETVAELLGVEQTEQPAESVMARGTEQ